jgi:hypothetical protein
LGRPAINNDLRARRPAVSNLPLFYTVKILFITFEAGCPQQMVSGYLFATGFAYRHAGLYDYAASKQLD